MTPSYLEYLKKKQEYAAKNMQNGKPVNRGVSRFSNPFLGAYRGFGKAYMPNRMANMGDWENIEAYLKTCPDIRCAVCFSCGSSAGNLYDKNNVAYKISRSFTLQQVKDLVEEIRLINKA